VPTPYFTGFEAPWFQATLTTDLTKWAVTMMLQGGVFERFPDLQLVMLESMGGWVPSWLERMDEFFEDLGHTTPMTRSPSSYFDTNIFVSVTPHERSARGLVSHCGADRVVWATDFPHPDSHLKTVPAMRDLLSDCSEADVNKVLGGNAQKLYGL
jgi:predicted TIM-barrel fold metal-dependent hydrolase